MTHFTSVWIERSYSKTLREIMGIFKCNFCEKHYTTLGSKNRHELTHGDVSFKCLQCQKEYQYQTHLRRHEKVCQKNRDGEQNKKRIRNTDEPSSGTQNIVRNVVKEMVEGLKRKKM
ncbi:unnamed protein product [Owenia fusiformis]|uniref:C2H2-type domain-containing protein n=1 Tax=Owenia fusiformis TaxID=6347 RepID=A0A8S4PML8_OWEFU|nr:unnamed protein product [Owenia fusiformis]